MKTLRAWLPLVAALPLLACGPEFAADDLEQLSQPEGIATSADELNAGDVRLRLMGANISSGNNQAYTPGEGIRIFQGVKPDVAMIQEFNYGGNTAAEIRNFVDTAFGPSFSYYREGGAQIPNGVISRYPILASGEWDDPRVSNRDFAWARIDIPGATDLWAISVHLLTASSGERNLEAQSLVSFIQNNIPAGDYVAIGGDFNTDSRTEAALSTFSAVTVTSGPFPADRNGNSNTNASRGKPYDWVIVSSGLNGKKTATDIGASSFANGLVADTRVYSPISEISPAQTNDSGAINMQHMGIVRDFGIPNGVPTATVTVTSPNGGESWAGGSVHAITWTSSNVANVKIESSLDGGGSWSVITSSTAASAGSFNWTVPSSATTSARVRISDAANASTSDLSNTSFTITVAQPASVTVSSPNGGESWAGGSVHAITWTSSNVANVKLESSLNGGSTWTVITSSTAASAGSFSWTVPSTATTSALVRVSDASDAATNDSSNGTFTITTAPPSGVVFINEILANETGSDVNGEFVEVVNGTTAAIDLSGWTVNDSTAMRHTFASGTSLAAGAAIAVFSGASGIPAGLTNAVACSTGSLTLGNSGDTVTVKNAAGTTVDTFTYSAALAGTDGVSMNRSPDASSTGTFVLHTSVTSLTQSPGKHADGSAFTGGGGGGGGGTAITSETEANNTAATANGRVGNGVAVSGNISTSTDADWFKVTVKAAGTVTVSVSMPGSADLDWFLYTASNTTTDVARGYTVSNPEAGSYAAAAGDYYVKVVGYAGAVSAYTLKVTAAAGVIDP